MYHIFIGLNYYPFLLIVRSTRLITIRHSPLTTMNGDYPMRSAVCYRKCFLLSYIEILVWKPCQCPVNSLNWIFHHCLIYCQHVMMLLLYSYWLGLGATVVLFWHKDRNVAGRQRQRATVEFEGHTNRCCSRTESIAVLLYLIILYSVLLLTDK